MITQSEALDLSNSSFPNGPEAVAERIGAIVVYDCLTGCEGWCWQYEDRVIIYINSSVTRARQRFTLAHELAHVLQGTPGGVVKSEPFQSDVREERAADKLAGELLLPSDRVISMIGGRLPIDADTLVRLGRAANVSPVTAACRVVGMGKTLKLQNAAIAFFDRNGRYESRYSEGLTFPDASATGLAGILGYIGGKHRDLTVLDALAALDKRSIEVERGKLSDDEKATLASDDGREFLRIHLSKTCCPDVHDSPF